MTCTIELYKILNLNDDQINNVCSKIGLLHGLRKLDLSTNKINSVCQEIGQLRNLQKLDHDNNPINNVCPELHNLQILNAYNNKINKVCPEIGQLQNLQKLDLSKNKITLICPEIGQLHNLRELNLNNNKITLIPSNIIQCNNLRNIVYHNNNIEYNIPCVQRFLDRIKNIGGTIINIYNDMQNVHTSSIQTSIKDSVFNLLNNFNIHHQINNYIEDSILTIKTKQLITEYIFVKETHSHFDCTFEEVFKAVWNEISALHIDLQNEIKNRLNEEMDDSECKCYTGRISRLVNCLSGYSDKVLIKISDAEQIGNIITYIKNKYKDSHIDTIKQIVRDRLTELKYDSSIIEEWIYYIN